VLGFGFLAQTMCGDVFISKRDPDQQVVAMIPSRELVLVRLGLTHSHDSSELARDLAAIVNLFPSTPGG